MRHLRADYNSIQVAAGGRYIPDDEPVFLLRAKDRTAPHVVREWAHSVELLGGDPVLVAAVRRWADEMEEYAAVHYDGGKVPDVPEGMLGAKHGG